MQPDQLLKGVKCDLCDYRANTTNDLIKHILSIHKKHPQMIKCQHCDYTALTLQNHSDHLDIEHVELSLLGDLIASQKLMSKNDESLKS